MSAPVPVEEELPDLLAAFRRDQLTRNGVPDAEESADRRECLRVLRDVLGTSLVPDGLRCSPLGPEWTDVFDAHLHERVEPARLEALGWLRLDGLRPDRTPPASGFWAVPADGRVLAGVRLHGPAPAAPIDVVLRRCRDRAEVRLREVLELRALRAAGHRFPAADPVLTAAAEIESGLGGRELAPWASGRSAAAPAPVGARRRSRRPAVVAVSGVDGSGKSTLHSALSRDLRRAGVDVSTVWVRPGMGLGPLVALAGRVKRLLRQAPEPGLRVVAEQDGARLASRSGLVGWTWAALVCASFLSGVWRQHRAATGVVLYDRHLVDALATLDFAYQGVDLRLHHRLVRALLPRADVRIYLDVPAEVSVQRKPDDLIGAAAVRRQLDAYQEWLVRVPPTLRLDATRIPAELAAESLRAVVATGRDRR
jgi:thymidylate kinase